MDALGFSSPGGLGKLIRNSLWARAALDGGRPRPPFLTPPQTSGDSVSRKAPRDHLLRPSRSSQTLKLSTQSCQQSEAHGWDQAQGTRLTLESCIQNEALTSERREDKEVTKARLESPSAHSAQGFKTESFYPRSGTSQGVHSPPLLNTVLGVQPEHRAGKGNKRHPNRKERKK